MSRKQDKYWLHRKFWESYNRKKGKKMNRDREIVEQQIKDHQKAINEEQARLDELIAEEKGKCEVTYSIGDRFKKGSHKSLLTAIGPRTVMMASLDDGEYWSGTRLKVGNNGRITSAEFKRICSVDGNFTRYWDACKKEYTGDKKEEPKPERIRVPEEIEFARVTGEGNRSLELVFNNKKQSLGYSYENEGWFCDLIMRHHSYSDFAIPLFLEPCKREDLKAGDWAFASDFNDCDFADKSGYRLILDSNKYVRTDTRKSVRVFCTTYRYWYKVVQ